MIETIYMYTDGSYCLESGHLGCGVVIVKNQEVVEELSKGFKNKRYAKGQNNSCEILAVIVALEYAKANSFKSICICYDNNNIVNCIYGKTRLKPKKLIAKYLQTYEETKKETNIVFKHVKAHSGNVFNERADRLAKKGRRK